MNEAYFERMVSSMKNFDEWNKKKLLPEQELF